MSVQFVYGRAGTGKSTYCFNQIKSNLNNGAKNFIITPEQFSYSAEKQLLETCKKTSIIDCEVITFNRMADRISQEIGGSKEDLMTDSSRAMLIYSILQNAKKELTFLGNSNENLDLAMKTITEFKKHNISTENLNTAIKEIDDINLKLKLEDMQKIYLQYEEKLQNKYIDEDDKLTKLAENLENSEMFSDSFVYVDEFAGFTAQEYKILKQIMKKAKKVTITSCIDAQHNEELDVFTPNKEVIQKLEKLAKEAKIDIEKPVVLENQLRLKNDELKHLEKYIYENKYKTYNKENKNIKLFLTTNPYSEIEYVAKQINTLVKKENYQYKDIAIITQNIENISSITKAIFAKYEIPIYIDEKDELSQNIAVKYILSILEIYAKNWSNEAVINYLKLGFCNISKEDIYAIENYTKKWGIKGNKWYKEDWNFESELVKTPIDRLNELRKKVVEPLIKFKNNLDKKKTAKEISTEIIKFIEENNICETLNSKISILVKNNELKLASEYKQGLENLISVIDEIVMLFENENITFDKYKELLNIGVKYKDLGSIPQTIDQVILGDVDRSRTHKVKVVFIISMNDGIFPSINKSEGFFNDKDRETLKSIGTEMAKGTIEMLYDEEFNIYKAMTIASEKLYLSYTSSDKDGKSLRSSMLITKIKKIFPNIIEESDIVNRITGIWSKQSTFEELLYNIREYRDGEKIDKTWVDVYNWYDKNEDWHDKLQDSMKALSYTNNAEKISKQNIEKLYGDNIKTSISRLEKYKECPFSFHVKYGLNLKEPEEFKIKSIDTGSFMHEIVDYFFDEVKDEQIQQLTREDVQTITNRIIEERLGLKKNAIFTSTPKFIVLTNRLKKVISESIYYIVYQMQNSDFKVLGNEVEFSKKIDNIEVVGKIDRVDIAENENGSFIRVIDYKSSSKSLDLNKMMSGLQIQLLTYVDVISEKTNKEPAGMLYFNLIEPIISKNRNLSDEEIEEEIRKSFKMKGLILADVKVAKMMDNSLKEGTSNIIPVTLDKTGNISNGKSSVLSKDEFSALQKKIKKIIKQIAKEILSGNIEIKPVYNAKQKKTACEYCPYKTICGFDSKQNTYEYIKNKTKDEIFEELNNEQ